MNKKVTITNSNGQRVVADIVTVFKLKDLNQDYVVYTFNQKGENNKIKDYVSRIRVENGEYYFDTISDNNEWEKVKAAVVQLEQGGM